MSTASLPVGYQGKLLKQEPLKPIIKVIIDQSIIDKIQYLCHNIWDVEWSGILFYAVEGSIKDPENMKCIIKDILPMHKGNKTYTEYELDDRFVEYMMEVPDAMTWKVGHIHSHNTMATFFSGTDMAELNDNSASHNYYLSLIVNNFNSMVARIAFRGKASVETQIIPYEAKDENGDVYAIEEDSFEVSYEKLYFYECDIQRPKEIISIPEAFVNKVKGIIEKAKKIVSKPSTPIVNRNQVKPGGQRNPFPIAGRDIPAGNGKGLKSVPPVKPWSFQDHPEIFDNSEFGFMDSDSFEEMTDIEEFVADLLLGTPYDPTEVTGIDDVMEILLAQNADPKELATFVTDNYADVYSRHFPNGNDESYFTVTTEEVIAVLEGEEAYLDMVGPTMDALKQMLNKFITA